MSTAAASAEARSSSCSPTVGTVATPTQLAAEMERLQRCSHQLVWLNPLKAHPDYEPLTLGMQAALPHVDHFLAGNSLSSLAELAKLMEGGFE